MNEDKFINIFNIEEDKPKKKIYIKYFVYILFVLSLVTIIILIVILFKWQKDNKNISNQIEEINDIVKVENIETDSITNEENIQNINPPSSNAGDYWDYINIPLINVDFDKLTQKNNDTVAWINLPNTNINYPVVQSTDNDFYLDHSFKKEYTDAGWIFMDYRNDNNFNDKNTIIYGHARLNKTMFGTLKKVITKDWFNNKENHVVKISTPNANYLYQVFSTYKIETENYYLKTKFQSSDSYKEFLDTLKNRSVFDFNCNINEDDKILTLSTCSSNNTKIVLHAKLIKMQKK